MADFARLAHILSVRRETWRLRVEALARDYEAAAKEARELAVMPPLHAAALAVWMRTEAARWCRLAEIEERRARALSGMAAAALRLRHTAAMARVAEGRAMQQAVEAAGQANRRDASDVEAWHAARLSRQRVGDLV
ncbi:MAG: hypothetical protein N2512_10230 [Armatimonadetes bacterium]|nr:hypothetical protein [Armatimonadota bacterium]